jgi:hypothetical protein
LSGNGVTPGARPALPSEQKQAVIVTNDDYSAEFADYPASIGFIGW